MNDVGVIDRFLDVFSRYIDSGFGLLSGEVAFLATTLIVIDVTLAALFWTWAADDDVLARLVKKTLFVGVFAYIIGNWNGLARIIFESFAGLGLQASAARSAPPTSSALAASRRSASRRAAHPGVHLGPDGLRQLLRELHPDLDPAVRLGAGDPQLLHPGDPALRHADRVQADHARRLRADPVRLFGKTAFLAERVLGNVISSGVKVLVLGRDRRHRLDALLRVHRRLQRRRAHHRGRARHRARGAVVLGLGITAPHSLRHRFGRTAALGAQRSVPALPQAGSRAGYGPLGSARAPSGCRRRQPHGGGHYGSAHTRTSGTKWVAPAVASRPEGSPAVAGPSAYLRTQVGPASPLRLRRRDRGQLVPRNRRRRDSPRASTATREDSLRIDDRRLGDSICVAAKP
jgi:hypothetical protein